MILKIGIMTFQRSVSYGAFLQCLALQNTLTSLGYAVEVIDYHPAHRAQKAGLMRSKRSGVFNKANLLRFVQMRKFASATREHLKLTDRRFETVSDLQAISRQFGAIVCGSDQIWNAEHTGGVFDPSYFAAFAADGVRRIAYAASLGGNNIGESNQSDFKTLAGQMNCVSLREHSGQQLAERLLQKKCYQEPDPTFLLENFSPIVVRPKAKQPYVFSFRMQRSKLSDAVLDAAIKKYDVGVIHVRDNASVATSDVQKTIPTPEEWLGLIASAEHVVTNSFHAVALSIILQRPFTAVGLTGTSENRSERMVSLLKTFGLSDLYCDRIEAAPAAVAASALIDWHAVNSIKQSERARGIDYLTAALESK